MASGNIETRDVTGYFVSTPTYDPDVPYMFTDREVTGPREVIPRGQQIAFLSDRRRQVLVDVLQDRKTLCHYIKIEA